MTLFHSTSRPRENACDPKMCMCVGTKKSESRKDAEILRMLLKPYFWLMFCVKNLEFDFSTQHLQIMLIIFFSQVHGMFKISSLTANLK